MGWQGSHLCYQYSTNIETTKETIYAKTFLFIISFSSLKHRGIHITVEDFISLTG